MRCPVVLRPGGVVANLLDWRLTLLQHLLDESGRGNVLAPPVARADLVSDAAPYLHRFSQRAGRFATCNRDISDGQCAARAKVTWFGLLA